MAGDKITEMARRLRFGSVSSRREMQTTRLPRPVAGLGCRRPYRQAEERLLAPAQMVSLSKQPCRRASAACHATSPSA